MAEIAAWHAVQTEPILDPDLPIVDAHHHLWNRPPERYELAEFLADAQSWHNIQASCFTECGAMYRQDADEAFGPVGETEYINGFAAACASGVFGPMRACAAISAYADLRLREAHQVLEAHIAVSSGRCRGIRQQAQHDSVLGSMARRPGIPGLLSDSAFRRGFALLAPMGLLFEAYVYFTQLDEVRNLASAFPETIIVLNHVGGPVGVGPYAETKPQNYAMWQRGMAELARCPNVIVKLGGLGMPSCGFGFHELPIPPSSSELAREWAPYIERVIELFGTNRCAFESNFPVDGQSANYRAVWNAFKTITKAASRDERADLFEATARRTYGLGAAGPCAPRA